MIVNKIYNMDNRIGLKELPDKSVDCCVTSPPYFGLRDYQTGKWEGGSEDCDHKKVSDAERAVQSSTLGGGKKSTGHLQECYKEKCLRCGAVRIDNQIGLEETPELFVAQMVEVFTEVKRVLKDEGTLWLNLGDSYNGSGGQGTKPNIMSVEANEARGGKAIRVDNLKPKDLIGVPWMVAFALRSAGWYLRQDIIWHKPNPMPESVTDRCTKAHEYIFLLSKSARYYYDYEAIKQEAIAGWNGSTFDDGKTGEMKHTRGGTKRIKLGEKSFSRGQAAGRGIEPSGNGKNDYYELKDGANKRSVWTVTTKPFAEAHFATFPEDLIVDCIKAGCPENGIVLDPFMGAGTTALVSAKLNRNYIGFELNPDYVKIAQKRLQNELGMFNKNVA